MYGACQSSVASWQYHETRSTALVFPYKIPGAKSHVSLPVTSS